MLQQQAQPTSTKMKFEIVEPSGKKRLLGYEYRHKNRILNFLIGKPLQLILEHNIRRHNQRMERLSHG